MACVALTSLKGTIEIEFLQPIPRLSLPHNQQTSIKTLFEKLCALQELIDESASDDTTSEYEVETRDFALRAEDEIETQLRAIVLAEHDQTESTSREMHFEGLDRTFREVDEKAAELLELVEKTRNDNRPSRTLRRKHGLCSSLCPPKLEYATVGLENDHEEIRNKLIHGHPMVAIIGMAGIGKTILATRLYQDPKLTSRFEVRGWITFPDQEHDTSQMLLDLFRSVTQAETNEIENRSSPDEIAEQVRSYLLGRAYLIVLDNFWNNQAWVDIQRCLPYNLKCRIIVTTRHFDPSYYTRSHYHTHYMTLLDPNNSWHLFCNVLSPREHSMSYLEKIRTRVMEKCDGLPELITAVAKRLSKFESIKQGWKKIEKELETLGIIDHETLSTSYTRLSHDLKVCFLYLGVYPKRSEIPVKVIIRLWIAEGFVNSEDRGYECLRGLIDRSLVLIRKWSSLAGKIKTVRLHSALHTYCVREAQKQGIFCALNARKHPRLSLNVFANSSRWLSLYSHSFDYYVLFATNTPRSVFFFHENPDMFVPFELLRVLAFDPSRILKRMPMQLGELVFLRYISVTRWFEGLDRVVSNNPNLHTLVVSGNESQPGAPPIRLPSSIWESPRLRHLEVGDSYGVDPPSIVKQNLQTLSCSIPSPWNEDVFRRVPNIRNLKLFGSPTLCLSSLPSLESLKASSRGRPTPEPFVFDLPRNLQKLTLENLRAKWGEISELLGSLQNLRVLKLENRACEGEEWRVREGAFPRLVLLKLDKLNLVRWHVSNIAFRRLEHLVMIDCEMIEEMSTTFLCNGWCPRSIEVYRCSYSAAMAAKHVEKYWAKIFVNLYENSSRLKVLIQPPHRLASSS